MDWNNVKENGYGFTLVTPCVGVWIETTNTKKWYTTEGSHPAWVCGLKLCCIIYLETEIGSHPAWVCGLKLPLGRLRASARGHTLRGCVDWNYKAITQYKKTGSHTLRGCVDWNYADREERLNKIKSHPAWVCGLKLRRSTNNITSKRVTPCVGVWIETYNVDYWDGTSQRHTLRGCVDWNRK